MAEKTPGIIDTSQALDRTRFEALFNSHYEKIRNYIFYKSGNIDVAEDIAQETFLKIWEIKNEIRLDTVKSLMYTIAGNIFNNQHQHKKVVMKFSSNYTEDHTSVSPEFEMEYKEFSEKLQKAISSLSEKNREVFLMNRIDTMTYNDIAETLGISVKAVEKRMNKALSYLRINIDGKI